MTEVPRPDPIQIPNPAPDIAPGEPEPNEWPDIDPPDPDDGDNE